MQYVKILALALLALVACAIALRLMGDMGGGTEQRSDGLIMEPAMVNLGSVVKDKGVTFSASMRNNGQKPVKIAKIDRSCSCLQAYPARDTCQPGETVSISATIVPNKLGRFREVVRFLEEDPSAPEHVIEVVGNGVAGGGVPSQGGSSSP